MGEVLNEIDRDIIEPTNKMIADAGMLGYETVTNDTPIDTGKMRSSWKLTKDRKSTSRPKDPKKPKGHVKGNDIYGPDYNKSKSSAEKVAGTFDLTKHRTLFISNNLAYAEIIDSKYSIIKKATIVARNFINKESAKI